VEMKVIVLHPEDNVATALVDLAAGELVETSRATLKAIEAIPFGHKIALLRIGKGAVITKYGETIGRAGIDIAEGGKVHVHNLESQRGRGDLEEGRGRP
jgi:altronate dehydratase small subunit